MSYMASLPMRLRLWRRKDESNNFSEKLWDTSRSQRSLLVGQRTGTQPTIKSEECVMGPEKSDSLRIDKTEEMADKDNKRGG